MSRHQQLDGALEALRQLGLPYQWIEVEPASVHIAVCPACLHPSYGLHIREGWQGSITLRCDSCDSTEIRAALAAAAHPISPTAAYALELAEASRDLAAAAISVAENTLPPKAIVTTDLAVAA